MPRAVVILGQLERPMDLLLAVELASVEVTTAFKAVIFILKVETSSRMVALRLLESE